MDPADSAQSIDPDFPLRFHVELPDGTPVASRTFRQPWAVVGRDPGSDLFVDAPALGRRQAYFQAVGGRIFCVDLMSRTRTCWEDDARAWGWVDPARGVSAGGFVIRPCGPRSDGPPPASGEGEGDPLPISRDFGPPLPEDAVLEAVEGMSEPKYWRISRALMLAGRSPSCKLQLPGSGVASIHAAFLRSPGGIWVADLLGPGGTQVNGRPTRWARLGDGHEVRIGPYRLKLRRGPWANRLRKPDLPAIRTPAQTELVGRGTYSRRSTPGSGAAAVDPTVRALLEEVGRMQRQMGDQFQQALITMFQMFEGMHREQMDLIRGEMGRLGQLAEQERNLRAELERRRTSDRRGKQTLRLVGDFLDRPVSPMSGPTESHPDEASRTPAEDDPGIDREAVTAGIDLHAEITRKIAAIQDERQGRLQRLLRALTGNGAGSFP